MATKKDDEMLSQDIAGRSSYSAEEKAGMSNKDQRALSAAGEAWNKANGSGDTVGMQVAHDAAEALRAKYDYSGGTDGRQYNKSSQGVSNAGFTYADAPSYVSDYQKQIDKLTKQILGRDSFSYDAETDPTYQQYKESYTRNGQQAMQDTLGQVSTRTGGLASSYAATASQQTYDNYMEALADKVPELRQLAYEMYQDEGDNQRSNLDMLMALEQGDYGKYQDLLSQYNNNRSFNYGAYSDDRSYDYQTGRDSVEDVRYSDEWAYQKSQNAKSDAQTRVENYLASGGVASKLDPALISASGYTQIELAAKEKYYADQKTAAASTSGRSSSGSSRSSSTSRSSGTQDYTSLFQDALDSGHAKSYISNNYKKYGFSSNTGLYDDYSSWSESVNQNGDPVDEFGNVTPDISGIPQAALDEFAHATEDGSSIATIDALLDKLVSQGKITEEQAGALAASLGNI
ncbi:MAG: hypothetical protein VB071_14690 [Lawsonibacter sp.]|nr:hypothetical protein [Lawsonibacter sp.]